IFLSRWTCLSSWSMAAHKPLFGGLALETQKWAVCSREKPEVGNSKRTNRAIVAAALLVSLLLGCDESRTEKLGLPPPEVVQHVSLEKYAGTWYEIARLPNRFQKGCTKTTATYTLQKDGKIGVKNACRKAKSGNEKTISGSAKVVDQATGAKLKVTFLWPLSGDYWILDLADDYSF